MAPQAALPPLPEDLEGLGRLTLFAVVGLGLAATVAMGEAPLTAPENLGILALGAAFLGLMLAAGERLALLPSWGQAGYFVLQLALAASIFRLQARLGSFGMAWILLMPLLAQGVFVWRRRAVAALAAAVLLLPVLHVGRLAGWPAALEVSVGLAAAVLFVLLFSAVTVREARARRASERLGAELAAANRRLGELAVGAEELATTRERNRLAREIHDAVGHGLTVANVQIEAASALLERDPQHARRALAQAGDAVRAGLGDLRRSVSALRAGPLADRSLAEALAELWRDAEAGGLAGELRVSGSPRPLEADDALTLYRVLQEALTNVRKHAGAGRVEIELDYGAEGVALTCRDDGRGPAPGAADGFGLLGLRERLTLLGGRLVTGPRRPHGFELRAEVPR